MTSLLITEFNVTLSDVMGNYSACASDLGLKPGDWPACIKTSLGNKKPFVGEYIKRNDDGDVQSVVYYQAYGCIRLTIFND